MVSNQACTRLYIHFENSEAADGKTRQGAENFHVNSICSLVCWVSGWTFAGLTRPTSLFCFYVPEIYSEFFIFFIFFHMLHAPPFPGITLSGKNEIIHSV